MAHTGSDFVCRNCFQLNGSGPRSDTAGGHTHSLLTHHRATGSLTRSASLTPSPLRLNPTPSSLSHLVSICGCCLASLQRAAASSRASHSLLSASPPSSPNSSEPEPPPPSAEVDAPPGVPGASWWSAAATEAISVKRHMYHVSPVRTAQNQCAFAAKGSTLVGHELQTRHAARH